MTIRLPVANDGWRFIIPCLGVGALLVKYDSPWSGPLGWLVLLAGVFSVFFFRDFNRATPDDPQAIFSPGDGRILEVAEKDGRRLIRIFLSVLDGHVQRAPVAGRVSAVAHKSGVFLDARHPEAHVRNEQNLVTIDTPRGPVDVIQIAGLIARRIVCWTKPGAQLGQGERYGLIRFGSQVDVLLPLATEATVKVGDRVLGGLTPIARWRL